MVFTLRKKLILGFIGLDIAISLLLGIAKFISSSIQGEEHEEIKSIKDFENPNFKKYVDLLERIYKTEKSVRYIYTLNYDSKTDNLYYAIDANKLDRDNVWVETEHFAYSVYQKDDKEFTANYDYFLRTGQFEIKTKKLGTTKHEFVKENDKTFLKINDQVTRRGLHGNPRKDNKLKTNHSKRNHSRSRLRYNA